MIYIDPPYNTGNDFVYEDNFADPLAGYLKQTGQTVDGKRLSTNTETAGRYHSNWLSMMYPRLTLARNLLREDGVIFISIDDNEVANLRKICDEVFGEENFVAQQIWKSKSGGANDSGGIAIDHEYILGVAKVNSPNLIGVDTEAVPSTSYSNEDEKGAYSLERLDKQNLQYSKSMDYELTGPNGEAYKPKHKDPNRPNAIWRWSKQSVQERFGELVFKDGNVYTKNYKSEGQTPRSLLVDERFGRTRTGTTDLGLVITEGVFDNPKPVKLIRHMLTISAKSDPSALILDFFAGSGTTAQAVLEMNEEDGGNRKFILVQLPEVVDEDSAAAKSGFANIVEITKERVRRVIRKLDGGTKDGLGLDGTKNLDRGFKVYALDRSNFVPWDATAATDAASLERQLELAVDNVVHGRSHADLLAEILLKTGFPLDTPITKVTIAGTNVYQVADPGFLVCLADTVDAPLIKAIAATKPHRVVILDAAFQGNDALKTNAVQAYKDQGVEMFRTA
jgi:adenine-specific DNA-methyltransferase